MQQHIAIIRACLARDPDVAAVVLEHHFTKAMQRALDLQAALLSRVARLGRNRRRRQLRLS
jgi:DNA-binding FadR family transcriptional regulator